MVAKIVTHPPKHAVGSRIIRVFKSVERPSNHKTYEEIDEMLDKVTKEQVKKALIDLKDPEEQMEALMRLLELQQDDLKTRTEIATHIQVLTTHVYKSLFLSHVRKCVKINPNFKILFSDCWTCHLHL